MTSHSTQIVIEAIEQISAAGVGLEALVTRRDPWPRIADVPIAELPASFNFHEVTGWKQTPEVRQQDPLALHTVACAKLLCDRVSSLPESIRRRGVVLGSAYGASDTEARYIDNLVTAGPNKVSPAQFRNTVSNAVLGHMAVAFQCGGASSLVLSGALSGLYALAQGCYWLKSGVCETVLAGVTDRPSDLIRERFRSRLERNPRHAVPLMDGSCLLLLRQRRFDDQGCWSVSGQAFGHMFGATARRAVTAAIERALDAAGLRHGDIDRGVLQTPEGVRACGLEELIDDCLREASSRSVQSDPGATSLPLMLNLCLAIEGARTGRPPTWIAASSSGSTRDIASSGRRLLFAATDAAGSVSILILTRD